MMAIRSSRQGGLTMLELAFVILILGILASTLVPALQTMHYKSMEEDDRRHLRTLKEAIIGQFLATGALPECKNSGGGTAHGNCDTQKSLGHLAVRLKDGRNNYFRYDVLNTGLANLTTSTKLTVCTSNTGELDVAITNPYASGPPPDVGICDGVPDYNSPGNPYCTSPQKVAFVLVATGRNRPGDAGEDGSTTWMSGACPPNRNVSAVATPAPTRVFERPERRANAQCYYDDIVEVVTLQELKNKCPL
jgi:type II secretory pathway pseudopilin PulG